MIVIAASSPPINFQLIGLDRLQQNAALEVATAPEGAADE